MKDSNVREPARGARSDLSSPTEPDETRRRRPPTPGECRLMAGLAVTMLGVAALVVERLMASGASTWLDAVGVSAVFTGLLLWGVGAVLRLFEL